MKKFALIKMKDLKVVFFDDEEALRAAIREFQLRQVLFSVAKFNELAGCYTIQKVVE